MLPHLYFKLLADETRVRCLLLLAREKTLCVGEISAALDLHQAKVSRHLALLRSNGLVINSRRGQWVFYELSPSLPGWMKKQIENLASSQSLNQHYQDDNQRLAEMRERDDCCI